MVVIRNNITKFKIFGSVDNFHETALEKQRIQHEILRFYHEYLIPKKIYEIICQAGSQRRRLYVIPKIH